MSTTHSMNSVIRQLYDGEIFPLEQWNTASAELRKLRQELAQRHDGFLKTLKDTDPALAKKFEELMEADIDNTSLDYYSMFYSGFCLGCKMIIEASQADFGKA